MAETIRYGIVLWEKERGRARLVAVAETLRTFGPGDQVELSTRRVIHDFFEVTQGSTVEDVRRIATLPTSLASHAVAVVEVTTHG
ncbi:hypothetical protein [Hyalangium sp.]|uniref:hypothetical protein n=1 Tax=Hyalangium sp. TaxID=2028555 RepID=UPI002D4268A7|nr:hypothetical protein [Hyalangium sp.]HYI00559.1 hypothetical protein [Hyalangium sp.]